VPGGVRTGMARDNGLEPRFCTACGKPLVPGARFCGICGVQVVRPQARAILPERRDDKPANTDDDNDQGGPDERI